MPGPRRVTFASAAPPVRYPHVYGINMPSRHELVAHGRTIPEIAEELGADYMVYQEVEDLKAAILEGSDVDDLDMSCFDGRYVTGTVTEEYLAWVEGRRSPDPLQATCGERPRSTAAGCRSRCRTGHRSWWNSSMRWSTTAVIAASWSAPAAVASAATARCRCADVPDVGDGQHPLDLGAAAEGIGILPDHLDELGHELRERHDRVRPEVDEPLRDAVALGAPAVLADQEAVVDPPALIAGAQAPQHPQQALRDARRGSGRPRRAVRRP